MIRMLIVDDERIDREGVAYLTRKFEFPIETCMAESVEEAMQVLDSQRVDILFTDICMPEQDGLELIRQAKEHQPGLHCVIYSAFGEFDYAKRAMQYGVRHYILKPLKLEEFRATIQAVLEDCRKSGLDRRKEQLLRLLLLHPGVAFTREKLMERVWGTDYLGETRTVDMHVRTLRQKLGACGEMIETVRGVGYRLEAKE